ncbi:MAG: SUMF1/EgtB/PvdO family nonheme iron enzyme [Muribaculaceae bacterium]|nr:SUMF1/EgtB/PvdO family nonheme iron enzyme [Muribaculaceae bacterium]
MKKILLLLLLPAMLLVACGDDNDEPTPGQPTVQEDSNSMTITVNGVSFKMIKVPGGTFEMGAKEGDPDAHGVDKPSHQVTLSSYYIGEMEVTQELWMAVMGGRIEAIYYKLPKDELNFDDCHQFINRLNQLTGKKFRLPTEAEWEFAARGGNKSKGYTYSGSNNLSAVAWTKDNSSGQLRNVGTKSANELGIYDMSGNAFEWCEDWQAPYTAAAQTNPKGPSTGTYRVVRGGSVSPDADHPTRLCHVYARACNYTNIRDKYFGFRLAL